MIIDLKMSENFVEFSFAKPEDFEASCSKWNIDYPDFEYYLSEQINALINFTPVELIYSALLELSIPIETPVRITLTKISDSWHFNLNLIKSKVTIPKEKNYTYCD